MSVAELLLLGCALLGWSPGEDGVAAAVGAGEQDGEQEREQHEGDGSPGGELGEQIGCAAGAEGGLRTLAAEGAGEIGRFALLKQDDADEEETDDDVDGDEKVDHAGCFGPQNFGIAAV